MKGVKYLNSGVKVRPHRMKSLNSQITKTIAIIITIINVTIILLVQFPSNTLRRLLVRQVKFSLGVGA